MSYSLPKSFKNCLTCTYWCGMRRLVCMERRAETDSYNTEGECVNSKGFYHVKKWASSTCSAHESLPAMKG